MSLFNRLTATIVCGAMLGSMLPLEASTRKGDKFYTQGKALEAKQDLDAALESYEEALSEDPADIQYQMAAQRTRFQASQIHLEKGEKLRKDGALGDALLEFQRAFAINPASTAAVQQIRTTQDLIAAERERVLRTGKESTPEERGLTPVERLQQETDARLNRLLPTPTLNPLGPKRLDLKINSTDVRTLFNTLGKVAGVNVLWDPGYSPQPLRNGSVDFQNATLEEALDYLAIITKSFWKPLSANTIFVTEDSRTKRNDYADQVMRIFYLSNIQSQQELQEIVNAVRTVTDTQRMFPFSGQNAIVARGEADQIELVGKIIHDLDRPKAEVVVDIVVMETSSVYSRQLTAALAPTGLNVPVNFTPRAGLKSVPDTTTADPADPATTPTANNSIPLTKLGDISGRDFSLTLPSALLEAVMSDARTKILQSPQVRSMDNVKASLKIGDRVPTATGSYQAGLAATAVNALVNTQFTYNDVGVNVDLTPRVHENGEVSMHIEMDISSVNGYSNIGGIEQPIIGQRKIIHDIRIREGEVSLLGGLIKQQETKSVTGIPGLSRIPLLRRLFTGESIDRQNSELLVALVPHIVRRPEVSAEALRAIAVGTLNATKLSYAPASPDEPLAPPAPVRSEDAAPAPEAPAAAPQPSAPAQAQPPTPAAPGAPQGAIPQALQQLIRPGPAAPAGVPGAPAAPGSPSIPATARFEPARFDTSASGTFTAVLVLDGGTDVASASPIQIQYDPKLLTLVDAAPGELFTRNGSQPIFNRNIMNDQGLAIIEANRQPGAGGVSGGGVLLTLRFQTLAPGTATVQALNVTARNTVGLALGSSSPQMTVNIR